jgi:hypothetical protein
MPSRFGSGAWCDAGSGHRYGATGHIPARWPRAPAHDERDVPLFTRLEMSARAEVLRFGG